MRRSPSIVPPGGDQDVYLVLDDFGSGLGRAWRETDVEHTDLETVIRICSTDSITTPFASLASTRPKAGRATFPRTWPTSCANAARIRGAICPSRCRNSLSGPGV
jgi:hypothetical protein